MASKTSPLNRTLWPPAPSGSQYRSTDGPNAVIEPILAPRTVAEHPGPVREVVRVNPQWAGSSPGGDGRVRRGDRLDPPFDRGLAGRAVADDERRRRAGA